MTTRNKNNRKPKSSPARSRRLARRQAHTLNFELLESKYLLAAITVNNATDLSNAPDTSSITALMADDGGDGISLREAIAAANNTTGEDAITFDESVFTGGVNNLIRLTQGELMISESLSIDGPSVGSIFLTGDANGDDITFSGTNITDVASSFGGTAGAIDDLLDDNSRVLNFSDFTGNLTLSGLTVTGGHTMGEGGGIRTTHGNISLSNSTVSGNSTGGFGGRGGGIYSSIGSISLSDSTVSDNSSRKSYSDGGGIFTREGNITLFNSVVSGNSVTGRLTQGGGIYNKYGFVSLTNSSVSGNSTTGYNGHGGGIFIDTARISLTDSTVSGNITAGENSNGGGIYARLSLGLGSDLNPSGVFLINSTVSGNSTYGSSSNGGGIFAINTSVANSTVSGNNTLGNSSSGGGIFANFLSVSNSTVSGNTVSGDYSNGGGIFAASGDISLTNSTVTRNSSSGNGGGISLRENTFVDEHLTLINSIVSGNTDNGTAPDLFSPGDVSNGLMVEHSLIGDTTGSGITGSTGTGNILNQAALLGPLADNDGPTDTHALLPGSPAIDAGFGSDLASDQRGLPFVRSFDDSGSPGTGVDIGAFELQTLVLTVDTQFDENDGNFSVGDLSLREAITLVDDDPKLYTIIFDGSVFTGGDNNVIRLTEGELVIDESVTINGARVGGVVITGDTNGDDVTFSGTHITDVSASFGGAAGAVEDLLDDNSRVLHFLNPTGNLTLTGLNITGGRTTDDNDHGGGILFDSTGTLTVNQSTVGGNSTTGFGSDGGGIFASSGSISLSNSTFSGNSASRDGGGVFANNSTVLVVNSTVTDNSTTGTGGGISLLGHANADGRLTVLSSIVAGNTANEAAHDLSLSGTVNELIVEHSLVGDTTGSGVSTTTGTGNILNQSALLGPLADNGGLTATHALQPGSPAIDAGSSSDEGSDQRGFPFVRSFDDPDAIGTGADIGAFERQTLSLVVDNHIDESDGDISAEHLSLREAIGLANRNTGADTITFRGSVFTGGENNLIRLMQGELIIGESLSIDGTSVGGVVITGDANSDDVIVSDSQITDVSASFGGTLGAVDDLLDDNSRVLNFSAFTGNLTLTNLKITGGRTTNLGEGGGAIRFYSNGDLTLSSSSVSGNSTAGNDSPGGGIYTRLGNVFLTDSSVRGNSTSGNGTSNFGDGSGGGGGIYNRFGSVSLSNSSITQNITSGNYSSGAGIDSGGGSITLDNSTVAENSTTGDKSGGGGINSIYGDISISNSTLSGNSTTGYASEGGGIKTNGYSDISLLNSTVSKNSTAGEGGLGGGIFAGLGSLSLHNSTVSGNSATSDVYSNGGGVFSLYSSVLIVNSTVAGNSTANVGGGIGFFSREFSSGDEQGLTLTNSIVAGNTDNGTAPDLLAPRDFPEDLIVEHSLIGDTTGSGITAATGAGNILNQSAQLGPLADNGGQTQTHALMPGSPAIDAGLSSDLIYDQRGFPFVRSFDDRTATGTGVDIGAFELHALMVDNRTDEIDGNYAAGELSLREAVALANASPVQDTITFGGSVFTSGDNSLIRLTQGELSISESLVIDGASVGGVEITGDANGDDITLSGTNITDVPASFGGVEGAADDLLDDNSRVLNFSNSSGDLTLAGLTLTGGRTTGSGGGVLFASRGALALDQSTVSGNSTANGSTGFDRNFPTRGVGGGIATYFGDVSLTNSVVNENRTEGGSSRGGGIYTRRGGVSLVNSLVNGNSTSGSSSDGGGIHSSTTSLINSTVSRNNSSGDFSGGGGIRSGFVSLIDSTVNRNTTSGRFSIGGGIEAGSVSLSNSKVSGNSTSGFDSHSGGIWSSSSSLIRNSTISGNSTTGQVTGGFGIGGGGGISGDKIFLINSTVSGNSSIGNGGGIRSTNLTVSLINTTVTGNRTSGMGGGIYMRDSHLRSKLTIDNSIIAGNFANTTPNTLGTPNDLVPDPDFYVTINHSLIGVADGLTITGGNNLAGTAAAPLDPLLGPLADNGGPTMTHALLSGSPAIDAGDNLLAVDENGNSLAVDQRSADRVVDGIVDIGAVEIQPIRTVGQYIFYNNSGFDDSSNSDAIATDKVALRNGETATFENYTSYIHGINGIAIDLFNSSNLSSSDFQLKFGNDDDVAAYALLDSNSTITNLTTVVGVGVNGSDRVFIEFADGAITNGWLQVTVLANNATGLTDDDVFYFGNAIGESGNDPTDAIVNLADVSGPRTNQTGFGTTDVLNVFDFNRDAVVNLADLAIARTNQSGFTPTRLITPTDSSEETGAKLPPAVAGSSTASATPPVDVSITKVAPPMAVASEIATSELTLAAVATPELTTEIATPALTTFKVATSELTLAEPAARELATSNLPSFAVAANIETATNDQSNRADQSDEALQLAPLALVGAGLDTAATQQEFLDRVFETTGQDNDVAVQVQLTDIDALFESSFSVDV